MMYLRNPANSLAFVTCGLSEDLTPPTNLYTVTIMAYLVTVGPSPHAHRPVLGAQRMLSRGSRQLLLTPSQPPATAKSVTKWGIL